DANAPAAAKSVTPGAASLQDMRAAAEKTPLDFTARSHYGMALMAAGRPGEALAEFQAAVRLAPESPVAHHNLGVYYLHTGQPAKADVAFLRELELCLATGARITTAL